MDEMTPFEPPASEPGPGPSLWMNRIQALLEVLLLSGIVSSLIAAFPYALLTGGSAGLFGNAHMIAGFLMIEASITILLLLFILKLRRESPADLGMRFCRWGADSLIGFAVVPLLFAASAGIGLVFKVFFSNYFLDRNPLTEVIRTPVDLGLILLAGLVAGGIKEELQRAFILTRFRQHLGGATWGLVLWSLAFGIGHYLQGAQGMAAAGVFGFIFGVVYLARGSLVAPMVAHGTYNSLAILGYWFMQ